MDSLGSLNVFAQAAETRSFTAAGQRLGVSSSAVGKAISRLEERLGVRLFHRSTRTITLTPEGILFLERCRRILSEFEAAETELAETKNTPSGKLRVSLPLIGTVMMPAICAFMRSYPEIELDLDFSDRIVDIIDEGFDVVIRAGDVSDSRLMSRMIGEFRLKLVASPHYLARRGEPQSPEDLASHACLLHRFATSGKLERWPLQSSERTAELVLPAAAVANTIEPLIAMAEEGLGIACLPEGALRQQLDEGRLQTVLDDFVEHSGPFRLLWPSSRYQSPKLRVFIEFIVQNLFAS